MPEMPPPPPPAPLPPSARALLLAGLLALCAPAGAAGDDDAGAAAAPRAAPAPRPTRFDALIEAAARRHRLDPALIHAMIRAESGYDPRAVSHRGALGLMQLMPATAAELGLAEPFDPAANIDAGSRYLRRQLDRFHNLSLVMAAYYAGAQPVLAAGRRVPADPDVRRYVVRVIEYYFNRKGIPTGRP